MLPVHAAEPESWSVKAKETVDNTGNLPEWGASCRPAGIDRFDRYEAKTILAFKTPWVLITPKWRNPLWRTV